MAEGQSHNNRHSQLLQPFRFGGGGGSRQEEEFLLPKA